MESYQCLFDKVYVTDPNSLKQRLCDPVPISHILCLEEIKFAKKIHSYNPVILNTKKHPVLSTQWIRIFHICHEQIKKGIEHNGCLIVTHDLSIVKLIIYSYLISNNSKLSIKQITTEYPELLKNIYFTENQFYQLQVWRSMKGVLDETNKYLNQLNTGSITEIINSEDKAIQERIKQAMGAYKTRDILSLSPSPCFLQGYLCKLCSAPLFSQNSVTHPVLRPTEDLLAMKGHGKMVFVEPLRWMDFNKNKKNSGHIRCYGCLTRIGAWSINNSICSCTTSVTPAFKIMKSAIAFFSSSVPSSSSSEILNSPRGGDKRRSMAGFLRKFAEDSRETLKASFSLTTSREVAKKTPSGPQEVEFILATNYAELPKKYQQLLSKSKITQIQADNYWFATRQALRFTAKTHIIHYTFHGLDLNALPPDLNFRELEDLERDVWAIECSRWLLRKSEHTIIDKNMNLQQIWELSEEEKKEAINKYVATLGDIVPCNLAILYDHKEPGYIEMMTEKFISPGNPKEIYRVIEKAGKGGFGSVYVAKDLKKNIKVAIKQMPHATEKEKRNNFREINFLAQCNHKNIVSYHQTFLVKDTLWSRKLTNERVGGEYQVVMEYMEGGSLKDVAGIHTFSERQLAYVAKKTLLGLKYLHDNGIVHRDIKPGNVMLTTTGEVKFIDFGLGVLEHEIVKRPRVTGSAYWMSPEIVLKVPQNCKIDVYSLGATLLQLVDPRAFDIGSSTKTLFSISTKGRHFPASGKEKSDEMMDFLGSMLIQEPERRSSVDNLLTHQFLEDVETKSSIKKFLSTIFVTSMMSKATGL